MVRIDSVIKIPTQEQMERVERERDLWKRCADMFATAEYPHEKVMAYEAWEELSNTLKVSE